MAVDELLTPRQVEDQLAVVFSETIKQWVRDYWEKERLLFEKTGQSRIKAERTHRNNQIKLHYENGWDLYDLQIRFQLGLVQLQKIVGSKRRKKYDR